jgi:hypothetical protein
MTAAQHYWWLAPVISALALAAIVWFQWGQHRVRAFRLKSPFTVLLSHTSDSPDEVQNLHIPAHTNEVFIHLRIRPRVQYRQTEILFGFDGDRERRPLPQSILNTFIKKGFNRVQNPDKDTNHYIDQDNHYHIVTTADRSPPNVQALGFVVQTREPGRYPVVLEIITDCGEAKPYFRVYVTVSAPPPIVAD